MSGAVDSTAIEDPAENGAASTLDLVPRSASTLAVTPTVEAEELVARLAVIKEAMETAMVKDIDYGVIPGVAKPSLFKPGAEKLGVLFQLDVQIANEQSWGPGDHLTVTSRATVYHAPTGTRQGYGEGMCSTREKKYGKRLKDRTCPSCGAATILKSKRDPEWFCWAKKGGCGANFPLNDERIASQEIGEVENPDLPDTWNTVTKMAAKRARVDAILAVTGASALFTQDVEDTVPHDPGPAAAEPPPPPRPAAKISDERAQEVGALITEALQLAVLDGEGLSRIFTSVGVSVAAINREAVAALTVPQADEIARQIRDAIGAAA